MFGNVSSDEPYHDVKTMVHNKAHDVELNGKPYQKKTPKPSLMLSMGEEDEIDQ
jgi:hypothetical protein